jgi:hypothetical protein
MTVDATAVARGAFRGFVVLVLGSAVLPLFATLFPAVAPLWLSIVAVLAFVIAAVHQGGASVPVVQALTAAVCAYLLIVPLTLLTPDGREPVRLLLTGATAVVVGIATGVVIVSGRAVGRRGTRRSR